MDSPILKQIANFLQDRKKHKHWTVIFTCMAILVCLGTITALKLMGHAMTRKEKVLNCSLEVHAHTEECQDEAGNLICGLADYVVHVHNDDCYDSDGNLACVLPEIPAHVHSEECYAEEEVLICGFEEEEGHVHDDTCYEQQVTGLQCQSPEHQHGTGCYDENGNLTCAAAEHQHANECYDEAGNLICGQEAHTHMVSCYDENNNLVCTAEEHLHGAECLTVEDVLVCEIAEGDGGHTHTDECYETQQVLACGQLELHTHSIEAGCFEEIPPTEEGEESTYNLICEIPVLEEHVHTEEAGCFVIVESAVADAGESVNGTEVAQSTETVNSTEILAEDDTEVKEEEFFKACEGDGYIVSATYGVEAGIPEEAEFKAELITPESNPEHYAEREAQYREQTGDAEATMSALLKMGFYINGNEIEPKAPVKVTVQLVNEEGLPEGMPMTIVHFADEGNEVLDGSHVTGGKTSFEMGSFSEAAVGFLSTAKPEKKLPKSVKLSNSFDYKNDEFKVTFHIEGEAPLMLDEVSDDSSNIEDEEVSSVEEESAVEEEEIEGAEEKDSADLDVDMTSGNKGNSAEISPEATTGEIDKAPDKTIEDDGMEKSAENKNEVVVPDGNEEKMNAISEGTEEMAQPDGAGDKENVALENGTVSDSKSNESVSASEAIANDELEFKVDVFDENSSPEYEAVIAYAEELNEMDSMSLFQTLQCSMTYCGIKLDLSECDINVEVTPTKKLLKSVEEIVNESNEIDASISNDVVEKGFMIKAYGVTADNEVNELAELGVDRDGNVSGDKGMMTFSLSDDSVTFSGGSQADPPFTVQYYAYIDVISESGTNGLDVIDTSNKKDGSGGNLPYNNSTDGVNDKRTILTNAKKKQIYLEGTGKETDAGGGYTKEQYKIKTDNKLTEVYAKKEYKYTTAPNLTYFNRLVNNSNYRIKEIWSLKEGKNEKSTDEKDWIIYGRDQSLDKVHFTNKPETVDEAKDGEKFILIKADMTIRLVYEVTALPTENSASFYDYDISDGNVRSSAATTNNTIDRKTKRAAESTDNWFAYTNKQGINSHGALLAFGNNNTRTTLGKNQWSNRGTNELNKTNLNAYKGCTFGIADSLKSDGTIQYASGITAPLLFNEKEPQGGVKGKTTYNGAIQFERRGDTYTMTSVNVNGKSTNELHLFNNPSKWSIWTNNFWPMDDVSSAGTKGHDLKFGRFGSGALTTFSDTNTKEHTPVADDLEDHNAYFGMHYTVDFDLTEDYVGPLEYLFYGDDDMWVFLSKKNGSGYDAGKLVCDIGGVHSSVGEYVDLWDWIKQGSAGSYRLSFFYTERGASGSSCWMQFTLPSVSFNTPKQTTGKLNVTKEVIGAQNDNEYGFKIKFMKNGQQLKDDYAYNRISDDPSRAKNDVLIWNDANFQLKAGESIEISYLPIGTEYEITEIGPVIWNEESKKYEPDPSAGDYIASAKGEGVTNTTDPNNAFNESDKKVATGVINGTEGYTVSYTNTFVYELPETGGTGKTPYTMAGIIAMFGAGFLYRKKFRERRV